MTVHVPVPKFWFKRNRAQASLPSRWLLGLTSRLRSNPDLAHRRSRRLAQPRCNNCPQSCPAQASLISSGRLQIPHNRSRHKKVAFPNGHMAASRFPRPLPTVPQFQPAPATALPHSSSGTQPRSQYKQAIDTTDWARAAGLSQSQPHRP